MAKKKAKTVQRERRTVSPTIRAVENVGREVRSVGSSVDRGLTNLGRQVHGLYDVRSQPPAPAPTNGRSSRRDWIIGGSIAVAGAIVGLSLYGNRGNVSVTQNNNNDDKKSSPTTSPKKEDFGIPDKSNIPYAQMIVRNYGRGTNKGLTEMLSDLKDPSRTRAEIEVLSSCEWAFGTKSMSETYMGVRGKRYYVTAKYDSKIRDVCYILDDQQGYCKVLSKEEFDREFISGDVIHFNVI